MSINNLYNTNMNTNEIFKLKKKIRIYDTKINKQLFNELKAIK